MSNENSVGEVSLDLMLNQKEFNSQVSKLGSNVKNSFANSTSGLGKTTENLGNSMKSSMSAAFSSIGGIVAKGLSVAAIGTFIKSSVELGSNLTEVQNVVDTVFGNMSTQVDNFASNAMTKFGLSETVAKKYTGTLGSMAKAFGFSTSQSAQMAETLTGLAGDVSSFYDISSDASYVKLKTIFSGETEPLKELGIVMTENSLNAYAMANGFGKTTDKMSEQEKVALRYQYVLSQLSLQSGDFQRTQNSWANQVRVLSLQWDQFRANLGQGLINVITPIIVALNALMSKLVQLSEMFKNFTISLTGGDASKSGGTAIASIAGGLDTSTQSANKAGNAITGVGDKAASAAKKAQKSVMGFDVLNKLQTPDSGASSGAGGAGTGGIGGVSPVKTNDTTKTKNQNKELDNMLSKLKSIGNIVKKGFWDGFGKNGVDNIKNIIKSAQSIGKNLDYIFNNPEVRNAAANWAKTVLYNFGLISGSAASIGTTIVSLLIGGISKYLDQNKDFLKNEIIKMFDVSSQITTVVGKIWQVVADVFSVFGSQVAQQLLANVINIITRPFIIAYDILMQLTRDVLQGVLTILQNNAGQIKLAISNILSFLQSITSTLSNALNIIGQSALNVYNTYIHPAIQNIANGISTIVSAILTAFNTYIKPVLDALAKKFNEVIMQHFVPMIQTAQTEIGKIILLLSQLWQQYLAPFFAWLDATIIKQIAPVIEKIGTVVLDVFGKIFDIIGDAIKVIGGIITFLVGIFTGNWSQAWDGIKQIAGGVWDAIKTVINGALVLITGDTSMSMDKIGKSITDGFNHVKDFLGGVWKDIHDGAITAFDNIAKAIKSPINAIIDMINNVINGLNSVGSVDIGGHKLGINIPKIPRLANGGYIEANNPQLAIIGDNTKSGEIVTPDDKMRSIISDELNKKGNSDNTPIIINSYTVLDGKIIYSEVKKMSMAEARRTGSTQFA